MSFNSISNQITDFPSVLASPEQLPGFWIFMYRVSPFTYLVSAVLSTGVAKNKVNCSSIELLHLDPPPGQNCSSYLDAYVKHAHANLINPEASSNCKLCPMKYTDQFLATLSIQFSDRWRNVGLLFVFVFFNIIAAIFLYWLIRVPKKSTKKEKKE